MSKPTKEELTEAAVALVQQAAAAALGGEVEEFTGRKDGYVEAYMVSGTLADQGVLTHEDLNASSSQWRNRARKSLEGKVKRVLDAEAAKPDARILRFSSAKDQPPFRLDGYARNYYGQAVLYGTPELVAAGQQAFEERIAREHEEAASMAALVARAKDAGMPDPVKANAYNVTYDVEGLRQLVEAMERFDR